MSSDLNRLMEDLEDQGAEIITVGSINDYFEIDLDPKSITRQEAVDISESYKGNFAETRTVLTGSILNYRVTIEKDYLSNF